MSRSNSIYLTDWENSLKSNSDSDVVSREKIRESTTEEDINWLNEIEEQSNNSLVTVKKISMTLDRLLASESPSLFNLKNTIEKISNTSTSLLKKFSIKKLNKDYILEEQKEKKSITKEKLKENNIPKKEPTHGAETLADGLNTKIKDRNQAYAELEKIADFLQKIEPHSPTPYLIYKLLKWKNMTLEELVNDARQEESLNGILAIINSVKTKN
jgi:type VI secretion system protein ImpA